MKIQVAGPGCPRCRATERAVVEACAALNLAADISHVHDPREYARLGVRLTPAVIIDDRVAIAGKVPTVEELKQLLSAARSGS